jgi:tRNA (5-methylaminomethyl-2-thiouridylate)-methyltransferase
MKVAALVSGGVDSSVSLHLLKAAGHDVTAFYLKVWLEDELEYLGQCPWEEDLEFVHQVCDSLDIPVRVIPVQQDYRERVIRYAISEVEQGRTPNPDILCNSRIKFGCFYDRIDRESPGEFDKVATGHYAQVRERAGVYELMTAPDPIKDQTYFLSHLSQEQLSRAMFPIGGYRKEEVRELAARFDLVNQDRRDSQGLCFLGKISFRDFIKHHLGERPGDIVELESGERLGEHRGIWFHTIGQRQGLGLSGGPWYVARKDVERNIVYISRNYFSEEKRRDTFEVGQLHWIGGEAPPHARAGDARRLRVKLRHGEASYGCTLEPPPANAAADESDTAGEGPAGGPRLLVRIDSRDQGIAAGQFAVFYEPLHENGEKSASDGDGEGADSRSTVQTTGANQAVGASPAGIATAADPIAGASQSGALSAGAICLGCGVIL